MKTLLALLAVLALAGCGSNGSSTPPITTPDASASSPDAWLGAPDTYAATDVYAAPDSYISPLEGTWGIQLDANNASVIVFSGNTWKGVLGGTLTDGSTAAQIDSGTFTISGNTLTLIKTASSCEGIGTVTKASVDTFSVQGTSLTLTASSGTKAVVFAHQTSSSTSTGVVSIGCFDASGNFTAHAVTTVP